MQTNENTGKCFTLSFNKLQEVSKEKIPALLVHANIKIKDEVIGHAWVETNKYVVDMTQNKDARILKKQYFYDNIEIINIKKYTVQEVQNLLLKYGLRYYWEDWIIFSSKK